MFAATRRDLPDGRTELTIDVDLRPINDLRAKIDRTVNELGSMRRFYDLLGDRPELLEQALEDLASETPD